MTYWPLTSLNERGPKGVKNSYYIPDNPSLMTQHWKQWLIPRHFVRWTQRRWLTGGKSKWWFNVGPTLEADQIIWRWSNYWFQRWTNVNSSQRWANVAFTVQNDVVPTTDSNVWPTDDTGWHNVGPPGVLIDLIWPVWIYGTLVKKDVFLSTHPPVRQTLEATLNSSAVELHRVRLIPGQVPS